MPTISRLLAAGLLASASTCSFAGPTPAPVRAEIDALLGRITASNCQFERNRSWHNAADARAHLLRKLAYIEKRSETITRTEQFIEYAATKSSFTGRPYRVRCGNGEPVESRAWLTRELQALRSAK
ncbi:MAG: DUF5329 domain-containing protein [Pseudomonadota bacterium]